MTMATSAADAEYAHYGMLSTIAEANSLYYHAQCHYRQAASAHNAYYRVEEARSGTATLRRAFSVIQQDPYLNQQYPVLMAQGGYIPVLDLCDLDTATVLANDRNNEQKESSLYRKIMQFIRRCEEITIHQRSLLAAVAIQIRAENPSWVVGEGVGVREGYFRNNILGRPPVPIGAVDTEFEPIPFSHSASSSTNNDGKRNYNNILPEEFEPLPFANPSFTNLHKGPSTVDQVLPPITPDEVYLGEMRSGGDDDGGGGGGGGNRRGKEMDSSYFLPDIMAVTMNTTPRTAAEAPGARRVSTATDHRHLAPPQKQQKKQQKQKQKRKQKQQKQKRKLNNDSGYNNDHQDHDEFTLALGGRDDFVLRDFSF